MKKYLYSFFVLILFFFAVGLTIQRDRPPLIQKPTLNRLTQAPLLTLSKWLDRSPCLFQSAHADLESYTAENGFENPGDCGCESLDGIASMAGMWNECFGCLFVMFINVYNDMTDRFAENGVDPDTDFNTSVSVGSSSLNVLAETSSLAGYDRHVRIAGADGSICMNIHYSKDDADSSKVKAIMHLDSANCPGTEETEKHAMAMKFDLRLTDVNLQTATFFHTGDYDTNGFSVTGTDQDDIFFMSIEVDEFSGNPITTAWIQRLSRNQAEKAYINGEDDVRLFAGGAMMLSLNDTTVDGSDLVTQCVDDTSDTNTADATVAACTAAGYAFQNFPFTIDSIADKQYPTWTVDTLVVTADADVEDYF